MAGLVRNDRVRRLLGRDRVGVTMDDLPASSLRAEDARHANRNLGSLHIAADVGGEALHLNQVGKFRCLVPRDLVKAGDLAIAVVGCCSLQPLLDRRSAARERPKRIAERHIIPSREDRLVTAGVPIDQREERLVVLLDRVIQHAQRNHLIAVSRGEYRGLSSKRRPARREVAIPHDITGLILGSRLGPGRQQLRAANAHRSLGQSCRAHDPAMTVGMLRHGWHGLASMLP